MELLIHETLGRALILPDPHFNLSVDGKTTHEQKPDVPTIHSWNHCVESKSGTVYFLVPVVAFLIRTRGPL